jgi:dTDP-4-dehydrorhamnose reductase
MNIIILGSNGMLGNYVYTYLSKYTRHNITPIIRQQFDITIDNIDILKNLIIEGNVIINCIGLIPHAGIRDSKLYIKVNSIFPNMLSILCSELGIKLIHITTDCVFTGIKGNYIESDFHDETSLYGVSKSLGEHENSTVIRTSIIGEEKYHKKSLIEWVKKNKGKNIDGYDNHYWNGVTCLELSKIIANIIDTNKFWIGVRHIFSPTSLSKYELIKLINYTYKLNLTIKKYNTNNTVNRVLNTQYQQIFNIKELNQQIIEMYDFSILNHINNY